MTVAQPLPSANPVIASNVRAELARKGLNANRLPQFLGQTQAYWSRRTRADVEFDGSDLVALAELLEVTPGVFFEGTEKPSADESNGGRPVRRQGLEPRTR